YINILFTYTYLSNSKISKNAYFKFREHSQNSTIDESGISSFLRVGSLTAAACHGLKLPL
ncbi:hypothetical protein, partial [Escherichia coli]|uniref:hypothetical protein n=1 Tax=Escherichia coli TaxID=562 RepID=UPI001BC835AE